ncbi:MAG: hypothetical protein ACOVQK_10080 [Cyanobium sp.]
MARRESRQPSASQSAGGQARRSGQAGVSLHTPEMRHFARAAFLLSRQCARAGLPAAAGSL